MDLISQILHEINVLEAVKSSYTYYMRSFRATHEVENATMIEANLAVLRKELRALYARLYELRAKRPAPADTGLKIIKEPVSELTHNAIMHFRSDRRFKYNE